MNKFKLFWSNLRSGFWFLPSLIVLLSIALAIGLIEADSAMGDLWLALWPRLFGAGAEGAREMMSTIAGSMMTVVGVTFSMILVVLTLASSQYTSRILRNFMRSRITQVVLGVFAGVFAYCLIVLCTIRSGDEGEFVPNLAVFFGFILALGGVGALMFFIHHIASSIQASSIIASVAQETIAIIERLYPEKLEHVPGKDDEDQMLRTISKQTWYAVPAKESGYIQGVNDAALIRLARERKTIVRMEHGIGDFVVQNNTLASLALEEPLDEETVQDVQATFSISAHRTVEQDVAFGIRQIVDIALKALSPGINDTTTAVMCVDYLTAILARIAPRKIPSLLRYEKDELRVIAIGPTFASLTDESFDQIRESACANVGIMLRMLGALETISIMTTIPDRRRILRDQVQWIAELAESTLEYAHDRAKIDMRLTRVRKALDGECLCSQEKRMNL